MQQHMRTHRHKHRKIDTHVYPLRTHADLREDTTPFKTKGVEAMQQNAHIRAHALAHTHTHKQPHSRQVSTREESNTV